jgi:lysophospholipase L1-like esterase
MFHAMVLSICFVAASGRAQTPGTRSAEQTWVGSWAASQQIPEPRNALPEEDLTDATMRQIIHLSIGGRMLRVHMSNAFGTEPLTLAAVHIARAVSPASSEIVAGSDRALTFSGAMSVTIPAGAEYVSDPMEYTVAPLSSLTITFYEQKPPAQETSHPGSRATTYYTHGDRVDAEDLPGAKTIEHWYTISGVDVMAPRGAFAVVTLGDSITDGHAATTNGNNRWPDVLAERLQGSAKTREIAVLNLGTGGNRLLNDGLGPDALARFDRDVLAQAGTRYVMVLEGVNDLGTLHGALITPPEQSAPAEGEHTQAGSPQQAPTPPTSSTSPFGAVSAASGTAATTAASAEGVPAARQRMRFHFGEATPEQHEELVKSIIGAYEQIVLRAHAAGIKVIGTTITPFGGSGYGRQSPEREAGREKINAWILTPGHFDAVVDFAKVVADPQDPSRMAANFDSGDHLHPSVAGYRAMGDAIPLSLFEQRH